MKTKKVVVITGTSSGIGLALASYLASQNYTVYGLSRSVPPNTSFSTIPTDITQKEAIEKSISSIIEKEKTIDVLINNAGRGMIGPIEHCTYEEFQTLFNLNVWASIQMIQKVLPIMRKNNAGRIITVSSIASNSGLPFRGFYSASKSAIDRLTESLRLELYHTNIQCCTLNIGTIQTNIAENRVESKVGEEYQKIFEDVIRSINNHDEIGSSTEDLAKYVAYLIETPSVQPHHYFGLFKQKLSTKLKGILPQKLFEKLIADYSNLKNS